MSSMEKEPTWDNQDFYHFTLEMIGLSDINSVLERLQQSHIYNNLLSYLIWHACRSYGRIKRENIEKLQHAVFTWNEDIMEELQRLKSMTELHQHTKMDTIKGWLLDEINIAREMECNLLQEAVSGTKKLKRNLQQQLVDACFNVMNYCKYAKISISGAEAQDLVVVLHGVFSACHLAEVSIEFEHAMTKSKVDCQGVVQLALMPE
jgi:hypothetical protein